MNKSISGYYIYILSNNYRTTLYVGVTNNLERRILEHKAGKGCVFTAKYNLKDLMYYETFPDMLQAISREKVLKKWRREWKNELIKSQNPAMSDLAIDWYSLTDIEEYKKSYNQGDPGLNPG